MAYLSQASATVANSPKITISMWVQFIDANSLIPIMEFANASYGINDPMSTGDLKGCIRYRTIDLAGTPVIEVYLTGVYDSIDVRANVRGSSDPTDLAEFEEMATHSGWTPYTVLVAEDESLGSESQPW